MTADLNSPTAATGRITKRNILGVFTFLQESKILKYQLSTLGQQLYVTPVEMLEV